MRVSVREFCGEHKWEIVLGLLFAVVFGAGWEVLKVGWERAEHVPPDRLAAGTVRVMTAINLQNDAQRAAVEAWKKDHPSVLITPDFAILRMGSGFAVTEDGWVVTARHVVVTKSLAPLLAATGAKPYFVAVYPPNTDRSATVIEADPNFDTAILKTLNPPPASFLVLGKPEEVRRLDRVFASGYPSSGDYSSPFEPTVTAGEISKVGTGGRLGNMFHTTAAISAGNSGGPLIDSEGRVIGINIATPIEKDTGIAFSVSVEYAAKMLARRGVELPGRYERQGIFRQPWVTWTIAANAALLFVAYFGVTLRSFWRRHLKTEADPPYAGFWVRVAALLIDVVIVLPVWLLFIVLLIFATNRFLPAYAFVLAVVPVWCVYAALCEWRWGATLGKRAAGLRVRQGDAAPLSLRKALLRNAAHLLSALPFGVGFITAAFDPQRRALHDRMAGTVVLQPRRRSPWAMLAVGVAAVVILLWAVFTHWTVLEDRAERDLNRAHSKLWPATGSPNRAAMAALVDQTKDRMAWMRWTPPRDRRSLVYDHGLDLMLAGSPRDAVRMFEAAADVPWEALAPGTGVLVSSWASPAAAKTGWCYFDMGDDRLARKMFEYVTFEHSTYFDGFLGLAATSRRLGDTKRMREACAKAADIDLRGIEKLSRMSGQAPEPYYLTPSQLRAVQETLAACR